MAKIYERLPQPESGWKRIDDTDSNIIYNGTWNYTEESMHYNKSITYTDVIGNYYKFYFYGSKLRLITGYHYNEGICTLNIDGIDYEVDCYQTGEQYCTLTFEKLDLKKGVHIVTGTLNKKNNPGKNYIELDAIDIDEDGYLLSEEEYNKMMSCYIKQNNKYYSFSKDNYDTTTKMYKEITLDDINNNLYRNTIDNLTTEVTIGDETFRPIDKFSNFKIVSKYNIPKTIIGRKTKSSMIIANGDIYTKVASNIDKFTLTNTTTNNSYIKMAVSFDNGSTWKTYKDKKFVDLSINIAIKEYKDMTTDEKNNWKSAKETILSEGFTPDILSTIDFNSIEDLNTIRFAYVLYQDLSTDTCEVNNLSWQFDAKGKFTKLKENEANISFSNGIISIEPTANFDMILTNYMYN